MQFLDLSPDGFFSSEQEITANPQEFGTIKPGDIKYIDQNGDETVNNDDARQIGRSQSPFSYGLNLRISYKNLTFFALGTGESGEIQVFCPTIITGLTAATNIQLTS